MSAKNKYTSEFKKTIINLYHSGKSYAQIHNEYGVSSSALSKLVKLCSEVKIWWWHCYHRTANQRITKAQRTAWGGKSHIKKQLQYSLRTQTTIDCGKSSFKSTFNHHSVPGSPCKQKHILQMAAPFSVRKRAWKQICSRCRFWSLCQNRQAFGNP